jgi:hypothetical protein
VRMKAESSGPPEITDNLLKLKEAEQILPTSQKEPAPSTR